MATRVISRTEQAEAVQDRDPGAGTHQFAGDIRLRSLNGDAQAKIGLGKGNHNRGSDRQMRARTDHQLVRQIERAQGSLGRKPVTGWQHAAEFGRAENGAVEGRMPGRADGQAKIGAPLGDTGDDLRPRQRLNNNGDVRPVPEFISVPPASSVESDAAPSNSFR